MSDIGNPHDRFFREVFSRLELSSEFLSKQLPPAIAATLDFSTLDLRPGSFLDEELQQYYSDLLFRVNLQTGRPAYIYVLLEHKSYIELVSVVSLRETELFSAVLLRAAIRLMRHIFDPDLIDKLPQIWAEFRDLASGVEEQGFLVVMISYVISANDNVTPTELKRSLEVAFHEEGNQFMATIAQLWLEEGRQQALLTSIRDGLSIRFSTGYESLLQEIEKIQDTTQLQRVLNLLFKVTSLAEFQTACRALLTNENATANGAHLN